MVEKTSLPGLEMTRNPPSDDMTLAERLQLLQKKRTAELAEAVSSQKHWDNKNNNQDPNGVGETIPKNKGGKSRSASSLSSSSSSLKSKSSSSSSIKMSNGKRIRAEDDDGEKRVTEKRPEEGTKERKSEEGIKIGGKTSKDNTEKKAKTTLKPEEKIFSKKPDIVKRPPATTDNKSRKPPNGLSSSLKAELMLKVKDSNEKPAALPKLKPRKTKETSYGDEDDEGGSSTNNSYQAENDGTIKWTTLEHNGIYFPPPYEPHGIAMHYDGKPITLEPDAEEVATFFAGVIGTDHYDNPIFKKNFWDDFRELLVQINSKWQHIITEFEKCDFTPIHQHLQLQKEKKKAMTKDEKEKAKAERAAIDAHYGVAMLDGKPEKVGNFRMEPPGLFRGRGKHPKAGKLKRRVFPEQVTINIGPGANIPTPPPGSQWGRVITDNTVTWLATWTEPINRHPKYVFLAAGSSLKAQSDLKKFETARRLKQHVDRIRKVNAEELKSKEMFVRQRATALWLIDRLALRAGNEKGDDEADTVGCCSLRCEHIRLEEPNVVIFDFLGKDSIRYYNEVPVDLVIFKNLKIFMRPPKGPGDPIFDRLATSELNKYLNGLMPGLTAKVFRTYNASHVFQEELEKMPPPDTSTTVHDLVLSYNRANRQVAILCNHQRAIPKTHQQSMERLSEKILTMKYQRHLIRKELQKALGKKELKSQLPAALEPESDMDEETVKRKRDETEALEKAKAEKSEESQSPKKTSRQSSSESLIKKFKSLTARIEAAKNQKIDRDENKTTALGTSKTNYIDPRITFAWCQNYNVPVEKLFPKTLRDKFKWAAEVDKDWKF